MAESLGERKSLSLGMLKAPQSYHLLSSGFHSTHLAEAQVEELHMHPGKLARHPSLTCLRGAADQPPLLLPVSEVSACTFGLPCPASQGFSSKAGAPCLAESAGFTAPCPGCGLSLTPPFSKALHTCPIFSTRLCFFSHFCGSSQIPHAQMTL